MGIPGAMTSIQATIFIVRHRLSVTTSIALHHSGMAEDMLRSAAMQHIRRAAVSLEAALGTAAIIDRCIHTEEEIIDE
jgi:hypothetical protein